MSSSIISPITKIVLKNTAGPSGCGIRKTVTLTPPVRVGTAKTDGWRTCIQPASTIIGKLAGSDSRSTPPILAAKPGSLSFENGALMFTSPYFELDGKISYANVNVEGNVPACKVSASFFANVNEDRQCSFMGQRNAHHRKNDFDSLKMFTRYADGLSNLVINHLSNALSNLPVPSIVDVTVGVAYPWPVLTVEVRFLGVRAQVQPGSKI
jgi:hypothetical protein